MKENGEQLVRLMIGYKFKNPRLLQQALTHKSYAQEHDGVNHNEVLEFYGDRVIETVVAKKLYEFFGAVTEEGEYVSQKTEGQLTEIKKRLVCGKRLAKRTRMLLLENYIRMGKGETESGAFELDSVQENLFEAIVGAVALDCNWRMKTLERVVGHMLDIEDLPSQVLATEGEENYTELIEAWSWRKFGDCAHYRYRQTKDGYLCTVSFSGEAQEFSGRGRSRSESRQEADRAAYVGMKAQGKWDLLTDEVGEPNEETAINQLQELYQKGYITEPQYDFLEEHDENGNSVWRCSCSVGEWPSYEGEYASKKQGKRCVAYEVLCLLVPRLNTEC